MTEVLVIREGVIESVISDFVSFGLALALIAVGKYIESHALEWIGATVFFIILIGQSKRTGRTFYSITDAKEYLDNIDANPQA